MIGRYLKRQGLRLHFEDLGDDVAVRMYGSFGDAWRGFRKNAYLLAGGGPVAFALFFALYAVSWVAPAALAAATPAGPLPLATLYAIKGSIDRSGRLPLWVSALAPVALALGALLQLDSAVAHARGRVDWKGRRV